MTTEPIETPLNGHPVVIVRGHRSHAGWWRMSDDRVNLESEYGAAQARLGPMTPERVAADLLARLVERSGGRPLRED
jgi:hypothetical protein